MRKNTQIGLEVGTAVGTFIKGLLMLGLSLLNLGFAVYLAMQGSWVVAALVLFIGSPIALFVADIATAVLVAAFMGLGMAVGAVIPGWDRRRSPITASAAKREP